MKKFPIIFFFFIFLTACASFAAYPDDCTLTVFYHISDNSSSAIAFESIEIDSNGFVTGVGSSMYESPGSAEYGSCYHGHFAGGMWHQTGLVGGWMAKGACPADAYGIWLLVTGGKTCADFAPDCGDEWNALVAQCGGEEFIINWDSTNCTGECSCAAQRTELIARCAGEQNVIWGTDCTGMCRGENLGPQCGG